MKILVVGGGGREHAIIRALKKSPLCGEIWCAPGNGGISYDAKCKPIKATDLDAMVDFARQEAFDYVVVAQDDPLALGMVDRLAAVGIPAFGPNAAAARIEASKVFSKNLMKTDIKELDHGYELMMDLPGFSKDEIKVSLENGYLTISAAKGLDKDQQDQQTGHYIRRERYAGACERSFYVGEDVTQEDIKGEFKHGILKLSIPKKEAKPVVEGKQYISIEG